MSFKSFPTLVAYAFRIFDSFIFFPTLKKTSSPLVSITYVAGHIVSAPFVSQCVQRFFKQIRLQYLDDEPFGRRNPGILYRVILRHNPRVSDTFWRVR